MELYTKSQEAANFVKDYFQLEAEASFPTVAMITGSGSDSLSGYFEVINQVSYSDIPHMPVPTFHQGQMILAKNKAGVPIIICLGRLHYYEGYSALDVTFPIRILQLLGIKQLYMTNASGGLHPEYNAGNVVLIKDHINMLPDNPLRGVNDDKLGLRFPDMLDAYNSQMRTDIKSYWQSTFNEKLHEGVYACFQGPSLETCAEYDFLYRSGANLVGMSTVPEVIVGRHARMDIAVFSIVTNECYPIDKITTTTVEDVIKVAKMATPKIMQCISHMIG